MSPIGSNETASVHPGHGHERAPNAPMAFSSAFAPEAVLRKGKIYFHFLQTISCIGFRLGSYQNQKREDSLGD